MESIKDTTGKVARQVKAKRDSGQPLKPGSSASPSARNTIGDPNCPICKGIGFISRDLPVNHPDFGKVQVCECRKDQVTASFRSRLYEMSNLDALKDLTFSTFQPRGRDNFSKSQADSVETAFITTRRFAENLNGWLFIWGGYGCGKTHLAAAIANAAVAKNIPTLFLTVPDLLDSLRFTFDSEKITFEERFEEIRNIPLLILDDFGTQNMTSWALEKLFQIINYRYINHLPLVVTSNQTVELIEGRLRSRFLDSTSVVRVNIQAPDYRNPSATNDYPELSALGTLLQQKFESFDLRKGEGIPREKLDTLERAFQAAKQYADNPDGWLVFHGEYGCGKTHLAAAIGHNLTARQKPVLFVSVPDLLDHLRATFSPDSDTPYDRRFEDIRTASYLILDDLGTQSTTPWTREKLYQLFNHRYNSELPTVITVSSRLSDLDKRLLSRMNDDRLCKIIEITVPSYRGSGRKSSVKRTPRSSLENTPL
ncbi:MAG: AFG1/ZapE family ATPase [Anaerolineaceae bacterium]